MNNIAAQKAVIDLELNEIDAEMASLYARMASLHEDLSRLDKAEAAIKGLSLTTLKTAKPAKVKRETPTKSNLTIKEMVLIILKDYPDGLIALDILSKINSHFDKTFIRTSLSPQLSRLKQSGDINKFGKHWLLTNKKLMEAQM